MRNLLINQKPNLKLEDMSKYNFDEIVDRFNSGSYKWDVKKGELPMWVADMDFHVLPEIKEAIKSRLEIDSYGYCECPEQYFRSYSIWFKKQYNLELDIKWMTFSSGVVASIDSILKHLIPQGSGVIVQSPVYHVFYHCIENNNMKVVENQLIYDKTYKINFEQLESLLQDKNNKAFILCNPHNPVGRAWTRDELKKISKLCDKYGVLLMSDEIHCDITKPGLRYTSIYSVTKNAIMLVSPSKTFNIAGIHASVAVCANDKLREKMKEGFGQDDIGEPNYIAPYATMAAYMLGDEWVKEMREYVFNNKKYIQDFLASELPDVYLIDNEATYLLWIDISKYSNDSTKFVNDLRKETGLFVSPGKPFGSGGEGFIRVNVATSLDNVKDACERLKKFIEKYAK